MKNFIKSLELRISDLFLLIGFLPFAIFLIFGQIFMQYQDPQQVALPLWAGIICFIVMIGSWGYYLYLEVYRSKEKYNLYILSVFAGLLLLNIVAIAVQPSMVVENVIIRAVQDRDPSLIGTSLPAISYVSDTHKFMFIAELSAVISFIYIGLFVLPKRFKNISFVKYLGYALFVFLGVLILYGYIAEYNDYVGFFKYLLGIDRPEDKSIYYFTIESFIIHRNAYGMCMMLGIIFAFINHSIDRKWYYYLFAAIFYINMIFSLCKTGLLISALIILIYIIYRLIATYHENPKRNKIILITGGSIVGLAILVIGISYISEGKTLGFVYSMIKSIGGNGETLDTRTYIWDNSFQLLQNGWWLIGRGFGTYNLMLLPMNEISHEDPVFPAHSAYVGLLAEGGILFLLAYLCLLGYSVYIALKCFKKEKGLTVAMSLGAIAFILYSFIEAIHYLVYVFLFPIMVLYHINYELKEEK